MEELKRFVRKYEGRELEFSIMKYLDRNRVLFKILFDNEAQFTAEIRPIDFFSKIDKEPINLLYYQLFTKERIVGDITLKEILHDAIPIEGSLRNFFIPNPNSAYKGNYPLGMNGGYVILKEESDGFIMEIKDLSQQKNLNGKYKVRYTSRKERDKKGRVCYVFRMYKIL